MTNILHIFHDNCS